MGNADDVPFSSTVRQCAWQNALVNMHSHRLAMFCYVGSTTASMAHSTACRRRSRPRARSPRTSGRQSFDNRGRPLGEPFPLQRA
jgi:hypothetical protein